MDKLIVGEIAIVKKDTFKFCGAIECYKGSIVKITDDYGDVCFIFKSKSREAINSKTSILKSFLYKPDNYDEVKEMYDNGIKNINK